jgi:alpha-1,2-mannosyltransferase
MFRSLALGQGTGLVMLSLAVGIWGSARDRSTIAGIGLGLAAVLKVSPVILLVYLVMRGRRRVVIPAVVTAVACFALSAVVGRAGDLITWIRDVSPQVSKGTISGYNQSMVGAFARLTTHADDLSARIGPGSWYLVAYVIWAVALVGLWRARRGRMLDPLELGVLVLVILLAGPLSWDHYFVWAVLPIVLMADPTRWHGRAPLETAALAVGLGAALMLCRRGLVLPSASAVHADTLLRVTTSRYTIAAVLVAAIALWLLLRSPTADPERAEWADERGTPVGEARPVVAAGVHERG